jgi:hypothetical protein
MVSLFRTPGAILEKPATVRAVTFYGFCQQEKIEAVDFMKIDIEDAEYDFVLGNRNFFEVPVKEIAMEVGKYPRDKRYKFEDLVDALEKRYRDVRISYPGWEEYPMVYCKKPIA